MKKRISRGSQLAVIGLMVAALSAINITAQDSPKTATASDGSEMSMARQTTPVHLSHGVADVLKLAPSNLGDETLISFINNSGEACSPNVSEIIYLREQGVSDRVITAMLNQHNQTPVMTAPAAPTTAWATAAQASTADMAPAPAEAPAYVQPSSVNAAPPAPTYVQPSSIYAAAPAPAYTYSYPVCRVPGYAGWNNSLSFVPFLALAFAIGLRSSHPA